MSLFAPSSVSAPATTSRPRAGYPRRAVLSVVDARSRDDDRRLWATVVVAWGLVWALASRIGGMYSWHYFVTGGQLLIHPGWSQGGLHLFATHPELQMGPLTMVVAAGVVGAVGPGPSSWIAGALMLALGALDVWLLALLAPGPRLKRWVVAALVVIPAWSVLAVHYGHLDDVLALSFMSAGLLLARRRQSWPAAVAIGLAAAAKPWALPMLFLAWGEREHRVKRLALGFVVSVLPWLPFIIGDPRTMHISSFVIENAADSALRVWGVTDPMTPWWCRFAQLALGALFAWYAARAGRIEWVPLAVIASRLVIDPGTYLYYTSGLVLAALAVDLSGGRRRPRLALVVSGWLLVDLVLKWLHLPLVAGPVRAVFLVGLLALFVVKVSRRARVSPPRASPVGVR